MPPKRVNVHAVARVCVGKEPDFSVNGALFNILLRAQTTWVVVVKVCRRVQPQ